MNDLPLLFFVVGPTASGKSDLALAISEAEAAPGPEIINSDSVQFFEGVEIGAAKPPPQDLARVKHHLISNVPEGGEYTAGIFRLDALEIAKQGAKRQQNRWLVVGGSGFYVQALEKGMHDVPDVKPGIREQVENESELPQGFEKLHAELLSRDPVAAAKIHPSDRYRILRALELLRSFPENQTLSAIRERFAAAPTVKEFELAKIGVFQERPVLHKRIIERTQRMLKAGLIEEVEGLRARGLKDWAPLKSVGYREVQSYLDGELKREELEPLIVTSTFQLAKRQMTWFKRDPSIVWFDSSQDWQAPLAHAREVFSRYEAGRH